MRSVLRGSASVMLASTLALLLTSCAPVDWFLGLLSQGAQGESVEIVCPAPIELTVEEFATVAADTAAGGTLGQTIALKNRELRDC